MHRSWFDTNLEYAQIQHEDLDGANFWSVCNHHGVGRGRDLCAWDSPRWGDVVMLTSHLFHCRGWAANHQAAQDRWMSASGWIQSVLRLWPQREQLWRSKSTWGSHSCHSLLIVIFVYLSIFFGFSWDWEQESQNNFCKVCSCGNSSPPWDGEGSRYFQTQETPILWMCFSCTLRARFWGPCLLVFTMSVGVYSNENDQRHQGLALYFSF